MEDEVRRDGIEGRQGQSTGVIQTQAKGVNHVLCRDFAADRTDNDGKLRALSLIDEYAATLVAIALEKGRTIRGRVVKEDGTPVAGLNVDLDTWKELRTLTFHTVTDADGRFVWNGAPDEHVEFVFGGCQNSLFLSGLYLNAKDDKQTVVMKPALRLTASVIDANTGKPIPNVTLTSGTYWRPESVSSASDEKKTFADGKLSWSITYISHKRIFRIEAEGYEALESEPFETNQQSFERVYKLTAKK